MFHERFLFVKHRLKPSERTRLLHITRGLPHLRKLREIMDHMYALFDRRCRTPAILILQSKHAKVASLPGLTQAPPWERAHLGRLGSGRDARAPRQGLHGAKAMSR